MLGVTARLIARTGLPAEGYERVGELPVYAPQWWQVSAPSFTRLRHRGHATAWSSLKTVPTHTGALE